MRKGRKTIRSVLGSSDLKSSDLKSRPNYEDYPQLQKVIEHCYREIRERLGFKPKVNPIKGGRLEIKTDDPRLAKGAAYQVVRDHWNSDCGMNAEFGDDAVVVGLGKRFMSGDSRNAAKYARLV